MTTTQPLGRCVSGKPSYPTPEAAQRMIKRLRGLRRNRGKTLRAYHCEWCGSTHITSTPTITDGQRRRKQKRIGGWVS